MTKSRRAAPAPPRPYGRGTGTPNPVDVHVGGRIRMRRLLLGMNQETLAARLGLTFQQVQKYESGANRVSASRLSAIGEVLDVPIGYFYADMHLNLEDLSGEERKWREHLQRPETIELVRVYYAMPDYDTRSQFLQLIKTVADAQAPASEGVAHA